MSHPSTTNATKTQTTSSSAPATASSASPATTTPVFNYAQAAAKSKASSTAGTDASSGASTPAHASAAASQFGSNDSPAPAGKNANASTTQQHNTKVSMPPSTASASSPPTPSTTTAAAQTPQVAVNGQHSRRSSGVSFASANGGVRMSQSINFGSVQDQNAILSSSPAANPSTGGHLQGSHPAAFGSVQAQAPREKIVGFGTGARPHHEQSSSASASAPTAAASTTSATSSPSTPSAPAQTRQVPDFNKLFQGSGSSAPASQAQASQANPPPPNGAAGAATGTHHAVSPWPVPATAVQGTPPTHIQHLPPMTAAPPAFQPGQHQPHLRPPPPAGQQQHHQHQRSFEAHHPRSPSQPVVPGQPPGSPYQQHHPHHVQHRGPSAKYPPASPGMPNATLSSMQMTGPPQQPWPQQQAYMSYPTAQMYGYYPYPAYEMPPASPRHPNMPSSPMMPGPQAPMSPAHAHANAQMRTPGPPATHPQSPATNPMSLSSSQHPPGSTPGPSFPNQPSSTFTPGHGLNPNSTSFAPRKSSAVKIVNPNTQEPVDFKAAATSSPSASPAPAKSVAAAAPPTSSPAPAPSTPSKSVAAAALQDDFLKKVREAKEEADRRKKEEAAKKAQEELEAKERAEREAKEKEEKERLEKEQKEREEREAKERAEREAREAEEKAKAEAEAAEAKRKAEEEAAARKAKEEVERKEREAAEAEKKVKEEAEAKAKAKAKEEEEAKKAKQDEAAKEEAKKAKQDEAAKEEAKKAKLVEEEVHLATQEKIEAEGKKPADAAKEAAAEVKADSAADADKLSTTSVTPSSSAATPSDRPFTPAATSGIAGLPPRPVNGLADSSPSPTTLPSPGGKKVRPMPGPLDLSAKSLNRGDPSLPSAPASALGTARIIEDINKVSYPEGIQSPKPDLNTSAEPGRFRYDRDFLLQFMNVYREKPENMPPLASIGMDQDQNRVPSGGRGAPGRKPSGMVPPMGGMAGKAGTPLGLPGMMGGPGGAFGAGMGNFQHPGKATSEMRFAATHRPQGGPFPSAMGAFGANNRGQPISRTTSGSAMLPGSGLPGQPGGARVRSNPSRKRGEAKREMPPSAGGPTIPYDQVAPLNPSENRWVPTIGKNSSGLKPDSPEMVQRKVKALLNKLTLEKFDSITDQILEWANKSVNENDGRTLRQVIQLTFEKATDEAAWSEMYARLCRKLMEHLDPGVRDDSVKTSEGEPVTGGVLFRKYLLNRCQEDFERGWAHRDATLAAAKSKEAEDKAKQEANEKAKADADAEGKEEPKEAELLSEEYYEAQKAKRRGLGLIKFIGELFKLQMLTERIMHVCLKKLLSNAFDPEEEEIESLCKLMSTVGKLIDNPKARKHMDIYFQRMNLMLESSSINSRMRFMLLDVIELRQHQWVPRHDTAAPKTIAQIHEDAARQQAAKDAEDYARRMGNRGGPAGMPRGGSRRGQSRQEFGVPPAGPDGWSTVGGPQAPARPAKAGDLSNFGKIDRTGGNRPLSFGPSNVFAKKSKGGEDSSGPPSRVPSSSNLSSTNMFDALSAEAAGQEAAAGPKKATPSERPKLNLQPRTKPLPGQEEEKKEAEAEAKETEEGEKEDEAATKRKIDNDVKEFLEIKNIAEGVEATNALSQSRRSDFVSALVAAALEKKKDDVEAVAELFGKLKEDDVVSASAFEAGFKPQLQYLDDMSIDIPNAYSFMATLLASVKLPRETVESLANSIEGEGVTPPSARFLKKYDEMAA